MSLFVLRNYEIHFSWTAIYAPASVCQFLVIRNKSNKFILNIQTNANTCIHNFRRKLRSMQIWTILAIKGKNPIAKLYYETNVMPRSENN